MVESGFLVFSLSRQSSDPSPGHVIPRRLLGRTMAVDVCCDRWFSLSTCKCRVSFTVRRGATSTIYCKHHYCNYCSLATDCSSRLSPCIRIQYHSRANIVRVLTTGNSLKYPPFLSSLLPNTTTGALTHNRRYTWTPFTLVWSRCGLLYPTF
jgi:hypothetical protein